MLRDVAVTRIQDGLGFHAGQSDRIVLRLQEAQRELEKGKTLPRFLVLEDETLSLTAGSSIVALPTDFIRIDDNVKPYFIVAGQTSRSFIRVKRTFGEALEAYNDTETTSGPRVMVIRNSEIDFIMTPDTNYTIVWSYYAKDEVLTSNIENLWLEHAPDWLIGEAGWRMAMDRRDKDGIVLFDNLRKTGRAAILGEEFARDDASGPLMMGANL